MVPLCEKMLYAACDVGQDGGKVGDKDECVVYRV